MQKLSEEPNNEAKPNEITIKRSSYNGLLATIIGAIAIAAFFGGLFVAGLGSGSNHNNSDGEIMDAIKKLEHKIDGLESQKDVISNNNNEASPPPTPLIVQIDDDPIKGDPSAPLTIIEFSDFQCPFCMRFYHETLPLIEDKYINSGQLKFVYRDYPIDRIHPNARAAHIAAECADEQGAFWSYHDILFEKQKEWSEIESSSVLSKMSDYASGLDLDMAEFENCLKDPEIAKEIGRDLFDGKKYGSTGTPTFFVGNAERGFEKISGAKPFAVFESVIESSLLE